MKGWKDVFSFTYTQNVKGKTFKAALYGIAALIFIIFLAINITFLFFQSLLISHF